MAHEPNVGRRIQSETTEIENVTSVVLISRPLATRLRYSTVGLKYVLWT
jgi:hypothetical protein